MGDGDGRDLALFEALFPPFTYCEKIFSLFDAALILTKPEERNEKRLPAVRAFRPFAFGGMFDIPDVKVFFAMNENLLLVENISY